AGEVETELGRQPLDRAQPIEVTLRVEARAARRATRPHESLRLVDAQRLRVHTDQVGGDADHVPRPVVHQENAFALGSSRETFFRFSSASFSAFDSFVGTLTLTRAIRSPRPEPLSFGAPRPLILSSFPSCEPAGTFNVTRPSGVGTSTV